jgi:hypothetical protein
MAIYLAIPMAFERRYCKERKKSRRQRQAGLVAYVE